MNSTGDITKGNLCPSFFNQSVLLSKDYILSKINFLELQTYSKMEN